MYIYIVIHISHSLYNISRVICQKGLIGHRPGHQSGQAESSEKTYANFQNNVSFRAYVVVSYIC